VPLSVACVWKFKFVCLFLSCKERKILRPCTAAVVRVMACVERLTAKGTQENGGGLYVMSVAEGSSTAYLSNHLPPRPCGRPQFQAADRVVGTAEGEVVRKYISCTVGRLPCSVKQRCTAP